MTKMILITRDEVRQALIDNKVQEQLGEPLPLDVLTDAFYTWLEDTIENHILPDIDHWALGPNGINSSGLRLPEASDGTD